MALSFIRCALSLSVILTLSASMVQATEITASVSTSSHLSDTGTLDNEPATLFEGYQGVLPCSDCDGVDTRIRLNDDNSFVETDTYLQGQRGQVFADYGRWVRQGDKLILTASNGDEQAFQVRPDSLLMLDHNHKPLPNEHQYVLQGADITLPRDPMPVRGLYIPQAGGAVLKDCVTGLLFTLQGDTNALRSAYKQAAQGKRTPMLVELSAHFAEKPDQDEESDELSASSTLVIDSIEGFVPTEVCQTEEQTEEE